MICNYFHKNKECMSKKTGKVYRIWLTFSKERYKIQIVSTYKTSNKAMIEKLIGEVTWNY